MPRLERLRAHELLDDRQARAQTRAMSRERMGAVLLASLIMGLVFFGATWGVVSAVTLMDYPLHADAVAIATAFGLIAGLSAALTSATNIARRDRQLHEELLPLDDERRAEIDALMKGHRDLAPLHAAWLASGRPWRRRELYLVRAYLRGVSSDSLGPSPPPG